ncbi:hypothetical protein DFH27DRAFT_220081 [Peziza echinospora]|nr:hypothetical protein DFH27DRAFT_220081 [Peziza echinospora]
MEYSPSLGHSFSFDNSSPPLTKNQRRLQLRQTLSSRTLPQASSYADESKSIIVQKTRQRSSSGSSKSSTRSNPTSPFRHNFEGFGLYAQYTGGEGSKPSTPEDGMDDSMDMKFGTPGSIRRRQAGRKASVYSEASTLVEGGFGDIIALGNQTLLGPRFCDSGSGSGSGSDNSYEKGTRESSSVGGTLKKNGRRKGTGRKVSGGSSDGYVTPPRRGSNMKNSSHHTYSDMHPEDAAKYIDVLEAQNQDLTQQLHNLTSPTSTTSNVSRLKKLTAENRALRNEIDEWHKEFEDKVREESRSRVIANEMEARSRIRAAEQALEDSRETIEHLHSDIARLKEVLIEVDHEKSAAENARREAEKKVELLAEMLREKRNNHSRDPSLSDRNEIRRGNRPRYSLNSPPGSHYGGSPRPLSIPNSEFEDSEEDDEHERSQSRADSRVSEDLRARLSLHFERTSRPSSIRGMSPTQEFGSQRLRTLEARKRMRSFEGGSSPQPLLLPTVIVPTSPSTQQHPTMDYPTQTPTEQGPSSVFSDSRPATSHSNAVSTSIYGAGLNANSSTISLDSVVTTSVRSVVAGNTATHSLFAELSRLDDDDMSDDASVSHRDDISEYSRQHSRYASRVASRVASRAASRASIASFHHQRKASFAAHPAPPMSTQGGGGVMSNAVSTTVTSSQAPRVSIFSVFTNTSSGPLHIVADAMTRHSLGKFLITIGHGLTSPRRTLTEVRTKARDAIGKFTGEIGPDRVSKRRGGKQWSQSRGSGEERGGCSHCASDRGRRKGAGRRSASAPISTRISDVRLGAGSPNASREPSLARERSPLFRQQPHSRKRRISTTSRVGGKIVQDQEPQVQRQHQVHAGDNVWMWFRFFMAIVTLITVNKDTCDSMYNEKEDIYRMEEVECVGGGAGSSGEDDMESDDNYMGGELYEDEETCGVRVERWRRQQLVV